MRYRRLNHPGIPSAIHQLDQTSQANCLVSVQNVVVDAKDRLWILDTASDGIALGAKAERLDDWPLSSRHLYSVSVEALTDPRRPPR